MPPRNIRPVIPTTISATELRTRSSEILDIVSKGHQDVMVLRGNRPTAFMVESIRYSELIEKAERLDALLVLAEDVALYRASEEVVRNTPDDGYIGQKELMMQLGLTEEDIEAAPDEDLG